MAPEDIKALTDEEAIATAMLYGCEFRPWGRGFTCCPCEVDVYGVLDKGGFGLDRPSAARAFLYHRKP